MTSRTLRRRLHHGDVDGKRNEKYDTSSGFEGLSEPLLGSHEYSDRSSEVRTVDDTWDDERKKQQLHWTLLFSQLIAQWAQWIANIVFGSGALFGRFLPFSLSMHYGKTHRVAPPLSLLQEERLRNLKQRLEVPFDGSRLEHQDALKKLWRLAYPDRELPPLKSELWKDMGWQGTDPSTDFRGGGFVSLENLIFFAQKYPSSTGILYNLVTMRLQESFHRLLYKKDGKRAEWEYPFAVAGINISFTLVQMLDLQSAKPSSSAGIRLLELLEIDEMAFDNLFCVAFQLMDAQWLAKRASYMDFNNVLKSTRSQLERELELEDASSVEELPAYNLLRR